MEKLTPHISRLIKKETNRDYLCPITSQVMKDPVILESGQTFERSAIKEWINQSNTPSKSTCPITRKVVNGRKLTANTFAKKEIEQYKEKFVKKSFDCVERHLKRETCINACKDLLEKANNFITTKTDKMKFLKLMEKIFSIQNNMEGAERMKLERSGLSVNGSEEEEEEEEEEGKTHDMGSTSTSIQINSNNLSEGNDNDRIERIRSILFSNNGNDLTGETKILYLLTLVKLYRRNVSSIGREVLSEIEEYIKDLVDEEHFIDLLEELLPIQMNLLGTSAEMLNRYIYLAKLYRLKGFTSKAISVYTQAVESKDETQMRSNYYRKRLSVIYNNRGILHNSPELEYNDLTDSINLYPSAKKYCNRGVCCESLGKLKDAKDDYDKSILLDKKYYRTYHLRGNLYMKFGKFERAMRDFRIYRTLSKSKK